MNKKKQLLLILEDCKLKNIKTLDIKSKSDIMDTMIIATGNSSTHVKASAKNLQKESKKHKIKIIAQDGVEQVSDWVLVDYGDIVVHIMTKQTREYYQIEKLWAE
jgi:ribosome-associated protein